MEAPINVLVLHIAGDQVTSCIVTIFKWQTRNGRTSELFIFFPLLLLSSSSPYPSSTPFSSSSSSSFTSSLSSLGYNMVITSALLAILLSKRLTWQKRATTLTINFSLKHDYHWQEYSLWLWHHLKTTFKSHLNKNIAIIIKWFIWKLKLIHITL